MRKAAKNVGTTVHRNIGTGNGQDKHMPGGGAEISCSMWLGIHLFILDTDARSGSFILSDHISYGGESTLKDL